MTFDPPYRRFEPGDLVFGTPGGRARLIAFFRESGLLPGGFAGPVSVEDLADFLAPAAALDPPSAAFHAAVRGHPKYADVFDPAHPAGFRERRHGKAALYWVAFAGGPRAHVSLAGLDDARRMRDVAEKSAEEDVPQGAFDADAAAPLTRFTKGRSAIGAELRWLYRHRHTSAVRERVQFWRPDGSGFAPCPPPWEWADEIGAAWQRYHPKREYTDADYSPG